MYKPIIALICFTTAAAAHGPEQWIADRHLADPFTKHACCGPTDCGIIDAKDVLEAQGGFLVSLDVFSHSRKLTEFVPYARALPFSPDGHYYVCIRWEKADMPRVRCFIVPPGTT